MPDYRIALCFSDTGGGHRSATDAIEAAMSELKSLNTRGNNFEIIREALPEKSHPINRGFVELYNFLLRHNQALMKYYYQFIQATKPNDSSLGYMLVGNYLERFIRENQPDVMVSVHPMCNQYIVRALHRMGLRDRIKFVIVLTDPNNDLWKGWACPEADLTIVPNRLARDKLIAWGVPATKIKILGMPVHPDFVKPPSVSRFDFRKHLGLNPETLTMCLNAGWAGGGNMMSIYRSLKEIKRPVQAIFLCGHNQDLYGRAQEEALSAPVPTAVLPFHDRMSDLMAAVDLMVTKAGGLTTFEAIARRLPMAIDMITQPMPQEQGTIDILVHQKLAQQVKRPDDIVAIVENFAPNMDRRNTKLPTAYHLDRAGAVYDIGRTILAFCDSSYQVNEPSEPYYLDATGGASFKAVGQ